MVEALTNLENQPFPSVIGQIEPRDLLMRVLKSGRLAHAYLFVGPEGTGKRALAIELARVLNCPKGVEIASLGCQCHSCVSMLKWHHPNLLTVFPLPSLKKDLKDEGVASDAAHNEILSNLGLSSYSPLRFTGTGQILIDHIREARDKISFAPDNSGMRILFIHPAETMNEQSANALLKLLEEPPERCLLLLTADSPRNVLPTILSRCQQVRFSPLPRETIASALIARNGVNADRAGTIASLANGSFTHAMELLDSQTDEMTTAGLDFLRSAAVGNVAKITETVENWVGEDATRSEIKDRLDITSLWILDALNSIAAKTGGEQPNLRISNSGPSVARMAERYSAEQLLEALRELEEAKLAIDANAMQSLALTALAIKLKRVFQS